MFQGFCDAEKLLRVALARNENGKISILNPPLLTCPFPQVFLLEVLQIEEKSYPIAPRDLRTPDSWDFDASSLIGPLSYDMIGVLTQSKNSENVSFIGYAKCKADSWTVIKPSSPQCTLDDVFNDSHDPRLIILARDDGGLVEMSTLVANRLGTELSGLVREQVFVKLEFAGCLCNLANDAFVWSFG